MSLFETEFDLTEFIHGTCRCLLKVIINWLNLPVSDLGIPPQGTMSPGQQFPGGGGHILNLEGHYWLLLCSAEYFDLLKSIFVVLSFHVLTFHVSMDVSVTICAASSQWKDFFSLTVGKANKACPSVDHTLTTCKIRVVSHQISTSPLQQAKTS